MIRTPLVARDLRARMQARSAIPDGYDLTVEIASKTTLDTLPARWSEDGRLLIWHPWARPGVPFTGNVRYREDMTKVVHHGSPLPMRLTPENLVSKSSREFLVCASKQAMIRALRKPALETP